MSRKMFLLLLIAVFLTAAGFLMFGGTGLAFAQEETPPKDASCIRCHEDQYYLYDTGKWYCLCKTPVRCTECHGGKAGTPVKDLAHEGLVVNPLVDNASACQDCHPKDYAERVEKFASIAGVSATPCASETPTPAAVSANTASGGTGTPFLRALPSGPWQAAGAALLGIAFLIVFLFSCRCWRIDRM